MKLTLSESARPGGFNASVYGVAAFSAVENASFNYRSRGCDIVCHPRNIFLSKSKRLNESIIHNTHLE